MRMGNSGMGGIRGVGEGLTNVCHVITSQLLV